jgi:hypothetical protein
MRCGPTLTVFSCRVSPMGGLLPQSQRQAGVVALARRAPDVDHSPIEVYVIPRELAQLAGTQAEGNRDDEQRLEPAV